MILRVQPESDIRISLQIELQVKRAVAACVLRFDLLPPVQKLAAELRINPNTVARQGDFVPTDNPNKT